MELIGYVANRVPALTSNAQHPAVPVLIDFNTDAPLLKRR